MHRQSMRGPCYTGQGPGAAQPLLLSHVGLDQALVTDGCAPQDKEHTSNSAFHSDNYSQDFWNKDWSRKGWTHLIKGHACYDPAKVPQ